MLGNTIKLRIQVSPTCVDIFTPEECHVRAIDMVRKVRESRTGMLCESIKLGWFLLQVKDELRHGEFGPWLASGAVHRKTAERCMRAAARCGDRFGEMDARRLFELLHRFDASAFPSFAQFDEHRISLSRVDRAIRSTSNNQTRSDATPPVLSRNRHDVSDLDQAGGGTKSDRMERMGLVDDVHASGAATAGLGGLPRARVGDVSGQGVLVELFRPFAQRLETFATRYDGFDDAKRRRAREIIDRCDRELAELMSGSGVAA